MNLPGIIDKLNEIYCSMPLEEAERTEIWVSSGNFSATDPIDYVEWRRNEKRIVIA